MRSLFVRIFLSYWLAQALFLILAILLTLAVRPSGEIATIQSQQARFLNETVQAYRAGGEDGTRKYLKNLHESQHVRLFIFDEKGHELLDRRPPNWIAEVARGQRHTADSLWGRLGPFRLLRFSETLADGQRYTMVTELPPEEHGLFGPHGVPGLGLCIAILTSGLVCYILARYLTSPIVRLRAATQKLASGDLTARAGLPSFRRRDEMAELIRDFDRMAGRLEALVNSQSRLLTDISHELRSPLARLQIALELARQRSGADASGALDRISREAGRLNELIQRLLTIARMESGAESIEKAAVNLEPLIREIAKDAMFEAQSRPCRVDLMSEGDCQAAGDAALLHSAIENVVRNAIRYTEPGSNVEVRLRQEQGAGGPEAVIAVTDSGPGVPDEALDKLFRPFYRIDDARGRQTGGVGLGLAITDRAVRLHGGTVQAANRPEGGLRVEIRLPLAPGKTISPLTDRVATLST